MTSKLENLAAEIVVLEEHEQQALWEHDKNLSHETPTFN